MHIVHCNNTSCYSDVTRYYYEGWKRDGSWDCKGHNSVVQWTGLYKSGNFWNTSPKVDSSIPTEITVCSEQRANSREVIGLNTCQYRLVEIEVVLFSVTTD